jgi:hypothetical protein
MTFGTQAALTIGLLSVVALYVAQTAFPSVAFTVSFALSMYNLKAADHSMGIHPQTELKVLGAGFPRTGTISTKKALERMGYKVFHHAEVASNGLTRDLNRALMSNSDFYLDKFVHKVLALGYNATLDTPMQLLVFRLARKFPDAKVLLTVRDSPEQWTKSANLVYHLARHSVAFPWSHIVDQEYQFASVTELWGTEQVVERCQSWFPWVDCVARKYMRALDGRSFEQVYLDWNARVRKSLPSERLLELNVKQGWNQLVPFAGNATTSVEGLGEFPKSNEADTLKVLEKVLLCGVYGWPFVMVLGVVIGSKTVIKAMSLVGL